jgi:hypothetical protein
LGVGALVYPFGMAAGVMAEDACRTTNPEWAALWLTVFWPLAMAAGAVIPAAILWRRARWLWVLVSLIGCGLVSIGVYTAWFPILAATCVKV